jgi:methyl-accepting chemotaxis protein
MLAQLVPGIQRTAELIQDISAACAEQSTGATQVNNALQELDGVIQQNASASEQTASTSATISHQARQLRDSVAFFQVEVSQGTSGKLRVTREKPKAIQDKANTDALESDDFEHF